MVDPIRPFAVSRLPRIIFGAGSIAKLPGLVSGLGRSALIVTGARSFRRSEAWTVLTNELTGKETRLHDLQVDGEPSPALVDDAVGHFKDAGIDVVIGIGGGSAMDAAKAIAGLLRTGNSVMDHLEGVGPELPYEGPSVPFVAVPTTAGSGSEATKNAVLSERGEGGFKKSFRDEQLVAHSAVVDPDLLASCPPAVIAANGMDAITQLLEAYVSTRANPFSDALALSGLEKARDALPAWYAGGDDAEAARADMAYAALLSGIVLAQVGLGSVHGLASPMGAFFPIPHGLVCGTLLSAATRVNIRALEERAPGSAALGKYADAGRLLTGRHDLDDDIARRALAELFDARTEALDLPRLGACGVAETDIARIVAASRGSSMKTNPVELTDEEIGAIVAERL